MMAMRIPDTSNPYGVNVAIGDTTQMGLVEMKETKFSTANMVSNLGAQFNKTLDFWQNEVDETMNRDNANEMQRFLIDQKTNEKTGWANLKGKNALERPNGMSLEEETAQAFKRKYEELYAKCGTNRQRKKLKELYDAMDVQRQQQIAGHVINEKGVWQADVNRRTLDTARTLALDVDNEVNHKSGIMTAEAVGREESKRAGIEYDPSKWVGPIHYDIVTNLLVEGRSAEASKYLSQHKAELGPEDYTKAKKAVEIGLNDDRAEAAASKIIREGGTYAEMLSKAETLDKRIRDKVRTNVRQHIATQKEAAAQELAELKDSANREWAIQRKLSAETQLELLEKAPDYWQRYKASMDAIEVRRAKGESPYPKFDDAVTKRQLENLIEQDPKAFMSIDFDRDANYISTLTEKTCGYFKMKQKFIDDDSAKYLEKKVAEACRLEGLKGEDVMKAQQFALKVYDSRFGGKPDAFASKKDLDELATSSIQMASTYGSWSGEDRVYEKFAQSGKTVEEWMPQTDWKYGNDVLEKELLRRGVNVEQLNPMLREKYGLWKAGKGWPKAWTEMAVKGLEKDRDEWIKRGNSDPGPVTQADIDAWIFRNMYHGR